MMINITKAKKKKNAIEEVSKRHLVDGEKEGLSGSVTSAETK